ncbi:alpha/beta hydrolase [Paenibacillus sp. NEAU-GSW1]|uniref:alpha/beta hydrolase n=1 Tax=Paenibacillus sp. NEAU-GSW1 TaxID=2682486 RepID=UPI001566DA52|nr:alpha/beta fold hydrolase [Paenibacillus sp. NEAU-GSW1]
MVGAAAIGAVSAFVIIGAAAAGVWKIGALSQRPSRKEVKAVDDATVHVENVQFTSGGSELFGWFMYKPEARSVETGSLPTVVIAHGWSSNRYRVLRYAKPLYEAGYAVFLYDARSHGESEGINAPSAFMFRDDVLAAVAKVKSMPQTDKERIVVLGHSFGGFGTLLALAKGLKVRAVVTDSMPVKFDTMMRSQLKIKKLPYFPLGYLIPFIWLLRAGISRAEYRAASIPKLLKQYAKRPDDEGGAGAGKTPVYMVHSLGDDFIPVSDLQELKKQLPSGTMETLFVDSSGHSASEKDPQFWQHVLPFINKHMK